MAALHDSVRAGGAAASSSASPQTTLPHTRPPQLFSALGSLLGQLRGHSVFKDTPHEGATAVHLLEPGHRHTKLQQQQEGDAVQLQLQGPGQGSGHARTWLQQHQGAAAAHLHDSEGSGQALTQLQHEDRAAMARTELQVPNLSGTWIKDKKASDCMDPVLRLMHMRGIMRQAIKLVKGVHIRHTEDSFTVEVFSVIGWFKVVERYNLDGGMGLHKRRDLRRGRHTGAIRLLPGNPAVLLRELPAPASQQAEEQQRQQQQQQQQQQLQQQQQQQQQQQGQWQQGQQQQEHQGGGAVALDLTWGEPFSGCGTDIYELLDPNRLCVTSTLNVGGQQLVNRALFHRKH